MTRSRDIADSQDNLGGPVTPFIAGKNKYINGDFGIWQRGTTFTAIPSATYTADRWQSAHDGTGTATITRQAFTPGAAPVAGYEGAFFLRHQIASAGTASYFQVSQSIEDVRTLAGQTATFSFWAKADTARNAVWYLEQNFGAGGSGGVLVTYNTFAITTSWARYSVTINVSSVAGKTIGTNSYLYTAIRQGTTSTGGQLDIWGIQLEAGVAATPFTPAGGGSQQAELALCQRYFEKSYAQGTNPGAVGVFGTGIIAGVNTLATTTAGAVFGAGQAPFKVTKRATPTMNVYDYDGTINAFRIYPIDAQKNNVNGFNVFGDSGGMYLFVSAASTPAIPTGSAIMFNWTASAEL